MSKKTLTSEQCVERINVICDEIASLDDYVDELEIVILGVNYCVVKVELKDPDTIEKYACMHLMSVPYCDEITLGVTREYLDVFLVDLEKFCERHEIEV